MSQICTCGIFRYTLDGFTVVQYIHVYYKKKFNLV